MTTSFAGWPRPSHGRTISSGDGRGEMIQDDEGGQEGGDATLTTGDGIVLFKNKAFKPRGGFITLHTNFRRLKAQAERFHASNPELKDSTRGYLLTHPIGKLALYKDYVEAQSEPETGDDSESEAVDESDSSSVSI